MDNMKDNIKIGLFAYNFPHLKTQDFIYRLLAEGFQITVILAADPVKLNIPPSSIKTKIRHQGLLHPQRIAQRFDIPYFVVKHNSAEAVAIVKEYQLDIGVIAGARILKRQIISAFTKGIINYHPGLIPESRGLDALLWSIYNKVPLGVTSHLINEEIDAGKILERLQIPIYIDDTIFDLSERLYECQLDMMASSIVKTMNEQWEVLANGTAYNTKMPNELEAETLVKLDQYIKEQMASKIIPSQIC